MAELRFGCPGPYDILSLGLIPDDWFFTLNTVIGSIVGEELEWD
jgi:hypothetical protein